ncbi:PGPGW domain-containing protein [Rubripirellula sp.]|nr:PGPGW domain-containing protein [Rubripirellula sp.]
MKGINPITTALALLESLRLRYAVWVSELQELLTEPVLWWSLVLSGIVFVGTLLAVPWIVARLPEDYFDHQRRDSAKSSINHRLLYHCFLVLKNVAGVVFLIAGVAMLVLPGQGLLTIVIGLSLINFPGKYRLERYLASKSWILRPLNWSRRRRGKPPFRISGTNEPSANGETSPDGETSADSHRN